MSFTKRLLSATFSLGQGAFGQTGKNQKIVEGLRMSARIDIAGGAASAQLSLDVWGMNLGDMNTLSTLGFVATTYRKNTISLRAGDADAIGTVFEGTIYNAYVDLSEQPDGHFHVDAQTGLVEGITPAPSSSWNGPVDVTTVLQHLAGQMGVPFENNGVSVILQSPYFSGSLRDQAQKAVKKAGIDWNGINDGTLAIWVPGQARQASVPLVSASTGLVGYVAYQANGVAFRTVFNPAIRFGGKVNVQSAQLLQNQTNAKGQVTHVGGSGIWGVTALHHTLESLVPHGEWFSDICASPVGYVVAPG